MTRAIGWLMIATLILAMIEGASFGFARLSPESFDQRSITLDKLSAADLDRWKATRGDDLLGWDNPRSVRNVVPSCWGVSETETYGEHRERLHGAGKSTDAEILIAGDSFTQGGDVSDDQTYPAVIERLLGIPTANLGVGGYGPVQALMKLEQVADRFPKARVVALAILYENGFRMVNSYWPVRWFAGQHAFAMPPYLRNGRFHSLTETQPFRDIASMKVAAETAFDHDFWRRPKAQFPFMLAVGEMLSLPSFWIPVSAAVARVVGYPEYELFYRLPSVRRSLRALYARFEAFAVKRGLVPIIVFIPNSGADQSSGSLAIDAASPTQRERIHFVSIQIADPARYRPNGVCHPNAEGYEMIAKAIVEAARPYLTAR